MIGDFVNQKDLNESQRYQVLESAGEFVNGEGFPYLGSTYRLQVDKNATRDLTLKNGYFILKHSALIDENAEKMDLSPSAIRVMDLKNRWAAYSPDGVLNFHWRCMMAPLSALEYIVVHELAHLAQPNHTTEFWHAVKKVLPDYPQASTLSR